MVRHSRYRIFPLLLPLLGAASWAQAQQVTLLDFSLPTCRPCRQMDPVVLRLEAEGFRVQRIDGSRSPDVARRFRVSKYPTFIVLSGQREVKRVVGMVPYQSLRQMMLSAAPRRPSGAQQGAALPLTFASSSTPVVQNVAPAGNNVPEIDVPGAPRPIAQVVPARAAPHTQQLLSSAVRLKVQDDTGHSFGTGTIVDSRQGEALVLTCAHLFRGPDGEVLGDPQAVTAELYRAGQSGAQVVDRVPVHRILSCNFESDVAFVSIRPNQQVRPARIAMSATTLRQGDPVHSVGCDHGADPTVRTGRVTAVNRYQGPPNVTASGAPVVGRSGGGLFSADGQVVGVCNAADYQDDEGIYAALPAIHAELDQLNLSAIYRGDAADQTAPAALAASTPEKGMTPLTPPVFRAQGRGPQDTLAGLSGAEKAALEEIAQRAADAEVVCVIRPKSPSGRSQVLTLENVSPAFVKALLAVHHEQNDQQDR